MPDGRIADASGTGRRDEGRKGRKPHTTPCPVEPFSPFYLRPIFRPRGISDIAGVGAGRELAFPQRGCYATDKQAVPDGNRAP
jgi:hypothetical protein